MGTKLRVALKSFEKKHIIAVLKQHNWHVASTAKALDIGQSSLYRKMFELGIEKPQKKKKDEAAA